jgi:hypothetical protein
MSLLALLMSFTEPTSRNRSGLSEISHTGIRPRGFKSRDVQLLVPLMPESGVAARRIDGA